MKHSKAVITNFGGITEETTIMGTPCLTLQDNTERPDACSIRTNELIVTNPNTIKSALDKLFAEKWKTEGIPEKWDGKAVKKIVDTLLSLQ